MMQITDEEYVILRGFFHETSDYRINHDMKKADNKINFKSILKTYGTIIALVAIIIAFGILMKAYCSA